MEKQRSIGIDTARGIAIILMVIGHAAAPEWLNKLIFGFHMPLFFLLSGYLFNREKWLSLGFSSFAKKRAKDYLVPYFVLAAVNLLLQLVIEFRHAGLSEIVRHIGKSAFAIVYANGRGMPLCGQLWFLPCLFVSSLLLYGLMRIERRWLRALLCLLGVAASRVIYAVLTTKIGSFFGLLPWHLETVLLCMGFLLIGCELKAANALDKMDIFAALALAAVGFYAVVTNTSEIGRVDVNNNIIGNIALGYIGAASLSLLTIWLSELRFPLRAVIAYFGRHTIIVVGFNFVLNRLMNLSWSRFAAGELWWLKTLIGLACCALIAFLWDALKRKFPKIAIF